MSKYNARALLQGLGLEENDLNININAEHEGDKGDSEEGVSDFTGGGEAVVETVETEPAPEPIEEDTSGTPEAAELDVGDASEEVETTNEQIEDVSEAAEGLEGIALTLARISVEGLEINEAAHALLTNQYNFVTRKYPALQREDKRVASFEAFSVSQEQGLTVSLEKVMDNLRNAGKAVATFLKDLWQKFLALLGHVTSAAQVMRKKATELSTAKAGTQPAEVNVPGIIRKIADGKGEVALQQLTGLVTGITEGRYEVIAAAVKGGGDVVAGLKEFNAGLKSYSDLSDGFLGGFKLEVSEDNVPKATAVEGGDSKSVKAFDVGTVQKYAKQVVALADAIETYKRSESVRKKITDMLIAAIAESNGTGDDPGRIAKWKAARKAAQLWGRQINFEQTVIRKAISAGNAVNNVCAASLGKVAKGKSESSPNTGAPQLGEQTSRKGSW